MEPWEKNALAEVEQELAQDLYRNLLENLRLHEFISKSNGRNRKRRKRSREVVLVSTGRKTISINGKLTKRVEYLLQDYFPEPERGINGEDWVQQFLTQLRNAERIRPKSRKS
ncbi:hypothetical protein HYV31_02335 [candidate division WWE3 bacterium]|nr:hypothetical protein [candidate division WWE3 bacterium]